MGALHQLSLDVLFCLGQIANASQFLTGNMRETLESILGETWQMVDLFTEWDWETYFQDYGQETSKYALVNPGTALKGSKYSAQHFIYCELQSWKSYDKTRRVKTCLQV